MNLHIYIHSLREKQNPDREGLIQTVKEQQEPKTKESLDEELDHLKEKGSILEELFNKAISWLECQEII